MIVLDASALVEVLLQSSASAAIERRLRAERGPPAAPHLIDLEATQVLRRLEPGGAFGPRRAQEAFEDLLAFPVRRYPHAALLPRVWQLRGRLTAYDAAYVALAEALGATLLTRDFRLARAAGDLADIEVL